MEEIIASISRIIAEDKRTSEPIRPVGESGGDVLELTEVVDEDGSIRRVPPIMDKPNAPSGGHYGPEEPLTASATGPSEPRPAQSDAGIEPKLAPGRERIVSAATSGAAAAAFAQLGALPRERRREAELPLGPIERTLEDMVRDMLRPLLESWLNQHLPAVVERLVREEIARVAGEAGLR